ncbi:polyprenol monophosphomannose synthase [Candidatus Pacearchaeota archaeon]|nr:MAG: polyprenol monophosphomannose synthase [Candidatus Pacearchaeota archaeon]
MVNKNWKFDIVIPTYNERENVEPLFSKIYSLYKDRLNKVIFVDDNSPDGTGDILEKLKITYPNYIEVIHRYEERGRGSAGIAGFKQALKHDVYCIVEMDADFSHDPYYIAIFLEMINFYDVVIASRYVEGGGQINRSFSRELISKLANMIYRLLLGTKITDLSGGFKCYRKSILEKLNFDEFISKGYSIGMETLFHCYRLGATFLEIPVVFHDRRRGKSKFNIKECINSFIVALKLSLKYGQINWINLHYPK